MRSKLGYAAVFVTISFIASPAISAGYKANFIGAGYPAAINDNSQVAFWSVDGTKPTFLSTGSKRVVFLEPDGSPSAGGGYPGIGGLSDTVAVGSCASDDVGTPFFACQWSGSNIGVALPRASLGANESQLQSSAGAVNRAGNAAGSIVVMDESTGGQSDHPALWQDGGVTLLPDGGSAAATGINDSNIVIGYEVEFEGPEAVEWIDAQESVLPRLGSETSSAPSGINSSGAIAGNVADVLSDNHAVVWANGTVTELPRLFRSYQCQTAGISDSGDVLGGCAAEASVFLHAVVWRGGKPIDLNQFVSPRLAAEGWVLTEAFAENASGTILVLAQNANSNSFETVTLTPD